MAAIIKGTVFNDLNNNGILDPGEPGIAKVYMVITNPNGSCTTVQTDASGVYTFSDLTVAGNYIIYETVVDSGAARLPTSFGQPTGFTNSSTFRTQTINVTQDEIDNNSTIDGENYGHDNPDIFTCSPFRYQIVNNPSQSRFSFLKTNLVAGQLTITKENMDANINAMGYNVLDNMVYGIEGTYINLIRVAESGSITNFGSITNLPVPIIAYNVGTIDEQGHMFIIEQQGGTYYVIDVDQNSPTFGRLLDPTAGYILDTAPFGTSLVYPPTNTINITDWSYSPIDGQLYSVKFSDPGPSVVVRINPTTGVVTELTTTGIPGGSNYGASFMDADGNFYVINNDTERIYRVKVSGNNAAGDVLDKISRNELDDYETLVANNGSRHQTVSELTLGTQVTAEDTKSRGLASNEEVRDYYLEIIEEADISVVKIGSSEILTTGDVLTYRLIVSNSGPTNARKVTLTDEMPSEILSPEFSIDGGITWNPWASPYNIGTMLVGESATILIRGIISETALGVVKNVAIVDSTIPDPDPTNNKSIVDVEVKAAKLDVIKYVDKNIALVGDTLAYTVSIKNTGDVDVKNVVFKGEISVGTSFIPGSVSINGVPDVGANPESGFDIGTIAPGETVLVSFTAKVESRPTSSEIKNIAVVNYNYIINSDRPPIDKSTKSNEVITRIEIVKVEVLKSADKTFVLKGDTITYTAIINNNSTISVKDVIFVDPIPGGTSFVPSSVKINDNLASGNPSIGINLGNLNPGGSRKVNFDIRFDFMPCPPIISNKAFVIFKYVLGDNSIEETIESNNAITNVTPTGFKQLSKEEYVKIPAQKPDAEEILNTLVDIEIINTKVIKTPVSTSLEGQKLTGFKLIVEGMLNQKVEYIACNKEQSVHAVHFRAPFGTFIVLPESYVKGTNTEIEVTVEDIYSQLVDKRTIFKNITFMITLK